jgi:hypothetical protein
MVPAPRRLTQVREEIAVLMLMPMLVLAEPKRERVLVARVRERVLVARVRERVLVARVREG